MLQIPNLTDMNTTTSEGSDRRDRNIILLIIINFIKRKRMLFYTHNLFGIERKQVSRQSVRCLIWIRAC